MNVKNKINSVSVIYVNTIFILKKICLILRIRQFFSLCFLIIRKIEKIENNVLISIPPTQTVVTFFYTKIDFIPIIFTLTQTITSINQIIIILDNYRVL